MAAQEKSLMAFWHDFLELFDSVPASAVVMTEADIQNLTAKNIFPGTIPAGQINTTGVITTYIQNDQHVIFQGIGKDMIDVDATDVNRQQRLR